MTGIIPSQNMSRSRTQTFQSYGDMSGPIMALSSPGTMNRSRSAQEATASSNVMSSLTRVFAENRRLRQMLTEQRSKIDTQAQAIENMRAERKKEESSRNQLKLTKKESCSGLAYIHSQYHDTKRVSSEDISHRSDTVLYTAVKSKLIIKRIARPALKKNNRPLGDQGTAGACDGTAEDDFLEDDLNYHRTIKYQAENPLMEVIIAKKLCTGKHKHFVRCQEIVSDDSAHFLVFSFVRGGDLQEWIKDHYLDYGASDSIHSDRFRVFKKRLRLLAKQMCQGVLTLHRAGFVHLDISPENVLFNEELSHIHLIDFGASRRILPGGRKFNAPCNSMHRPGKKSYRSPEIHDCLEFDGKKSDTWSLAVVLFTLMTGQPPFRKPHMSDPSFARMFGEEFKSMKKNDFKECEESHSHLIRSVGDLSLLTDDSIIYLDDEPILASADEDTDLDETETSSETARRRSLLVNQPREPSRSRSRSRRRSDRKVRSMVIGKGVHDFISAPKRRMLQRIPASSSGSHKKNRSSIIPLISQLPSKGCLFDETLIDLLDGMFALNEENRLTMEQVMDHPWFAEDTEVSSFVPFVPSVSDEKSSDTNNPIELSFQIPACLHFPDSHDSSCNEDCDESIKGLDESEDEESIFEEDDYPPYHRDPPMIDPSSIHDEDDDDRMEQSRDDDASATTPSASAVSVVLVYDEDSSESR